MSDKLPRCPECATVIKADFLYCPQCKTSLKYDQIDDSLDGVESIISDTEPLTSAQLSKIFKIFKTDDTAKNEPSRAHRLEEKICHKYIRSIAESEYTVKDMIIIAKKIQMFLRLDYSREW